MILVFVIVLEEKEGENDCDVFGMVGNYRMVVLQKVWFLLFFLSINGCLVLFVFYFLVILKVRELFILVFVYLKVLIVRIVK